MTQPKHKYTTPVNSRLPAEDWPWWPKAVAKARKSGVPFNVVLVHLLKGYVDGTIEVDIKE